MRNAKLCAACEICFLAFLGFWFFRGLMALVAIFIIQRSEFAPAELDTMGKNAPATITEAP